MLQKIIPALALALAVLLAGCADVDTLTQADRARAEAQRLTAQASAHDAEARLTSAQAISQTLALQAAQTAHMTQEALSRADRLAALALAGGLSAGVLIGAVVVLLLVLRADRLRNARRDDARLAEIDARLRMLEHGAATLAGQLARLPPEERARVRALIADAQQER